MSGLEREKKAKTIIEIRGGKSPTSHVVDMLKELIVMRALVEIKDGVHVVTKAACCSHKHSPYSSISPVLRHARYATTTCLANNSYCRKASNPIASQDNIQ